MGNTSTILEALMCVSKLLACKKLNINQKKKKRKNKSVKSHLNSILNKKTFEIVLENIQNELLYILSLMKINNKKQNRLQQ